uniref:Uncharacterized protein n=1 Tax=Arundo donax TaxID=35708 RepID=A0A0A9D9Z3_ARUDO
MSAYLVISSAYYRSGQYPLIMSQSFINLLVTVLISQHYGMFVTVISV